MCQSVPSWHKVQSVGKSSWGTTGPRSAHQPWGGARGTAKDLAIQIEETMRLKRKLEEILASHSGKSADELAAACDRDNFMGPDEAKEFGLIDHVITKLETPGS